ncbi:hypothetical protein DPM33_31575 [Mesorhizobium hawassense]|uniref:Uncharacterized protein n=3 Tax=Mesorhizobium TaxID=68287 RepID=A0A330HHR7_9HYPH|nr:hypothetical protein DPM33_31575 [Mesorhizobium hawassense]
MMCSGKTWYNAVHPTGEVAMANRLFEVLARRRSWLDRVALGLLVFLATLVAALMGGAST